MDGKLLLQLLKLMALLPLTILVIYMLFKHGGKYMDRMSNGRILKVIERVPLSQNNFLTVVLIDNKPYLISSGEKGAQILLELDEKVAQDYQDRISQGMGLGQGYTNLFSLLDRRRDQ